MGTHITRIGKQKFFCGLSWQSPSLLPHLRNEMAKMAELLLRIEANLITVHKSGTAVQASYTQLKERLHCAYPLVAAISRTSVFKRHCKKWQRRPVKNWLCALKLSDKKWSCCIVHHASFLPLYDFAGSTEPVLACLYRDFDQGDRNTFIVDAKLRNCGFKHFNAVQMENLLTRSNGEQIDFCKQCALRPVDARTARVQWSSVAAYSNVLTSLGTGDYVRLKSALWKRRGKGRTTLHNRYAMTDCVQVRRAGALFKRHHHSRWIGCLPHMDDMSVCTSNKVLRPAWKESSAGEHVCVADSISYAWRENESFTVMLLQQDTSVAYDATGDKAPHTGPRLNETECNASGADADTLLRSLTSRFKLIALTIDMTLQSTIGSPAPAQNDISGAEPAKTSRLGWKTFSLTLNTGGLALADIAEFLNYPAIRIDKSVYRAGTWSIEGWVYAR